MPEEEILFKTTDKQIDESKQGAVYQPESSKASNENGKRFYIESYGCQMNFADSEVVASILQENGFSAAANYDTADLILINTCAIRENAEQRVRNRLRQFNRVKREKPEMLVGVLGCMAERLKSKFLEQEKLVDIVVGPDAYRDLPKLVEEADAGQKAVNVLLSREETYSEINPVRLNSNGVSAFVSITRGCDNMCSFCVVPFTRGRERSRDPQSIVKEATELFERGFKEITLLGQNVDSYLWYGGGAKKDFDKQTQDVKDAAVHFADLLEMVAKISPKLRVRFSTSNPRDMVDDVLHMIAKYDNICNYIHLPVQSGNSNVLERMNRGHNREWYLDLVGRIRKIIPDCGLSTDIITGFCDETEEEHQDTLSLMKEVGYDMAYTFFYSERPGTMAERKFEDNIPLATKKRRLQEVIDIQKINSEQSNIRELGKTFEVLIEGVSKKSDQELYGRNTKNQVIVFPREDYQKGDYVMVKVETCTSATLIGKVIKA
ncbi:MAG: tRNA (N6-isopentenyl adenosine(37)-C2)-methylthiotransferase MiaB [Chitinophagales bacterium]